MLKKIRSFLKCFIFADLGSFAGRSLCVWLDYKKYPKIYEMRSAPWYTEILFGAVITGSIVLLCLIAYLLLGCKIKKDENKSK